MRIIVICAFLSRYKMMSGGQQKCDSSYLNEGPHQGFFSAGEQKYVRMHLLCSIYYGHDAYQCA